MASGTSLLQLHPLSAILPNASGAQISSILGASTPAEVFRVLAFDQTADEYADFGIYRMPASFAATTGITLKIKWGSAVNTGNVVFRAALLRVTSTVDLDTTAKTYSFTSAAATAVPGTIGFAIETDLAITNANMDSVTTGDFFFLRFGRFGSTGTDTATGDAYIHAIDIRET